MHVKGVGGVEVLTKCELGWVVRSGWCGMGSMAEGRYVVEIKAWNVAPIPTLVEDWSASFIHTSGKRAERSWQCVGRLLCNTKPAVVLMSELRVRKRGRQGGSRSRLRKLPFHPPLSSIILSNVCILQSKMDLGNMPSANWKGLPGTSAS